ncbi:hypothetical protein BX666DRAFT_989560 [Dichotomocladium elegans]|nr:hypothetical protein BX666DRAFT_989560 [Dichotomocladium elegans]
MIIKEKLPPASRFFVALVLVWFDARCVISHRVSATSRLAATVVCATPLFFLEGGNGPFIGGGGINTIYADGMVFILWHSAKGLLTTCGPAIPSPWLSIRHMLLLWTCSDLYPSYFTDHQLQRNSRLTGLGIVTIVLGVLQEIEY